MTKQNSYHKENLRQDLVDAGLSYVTAQGHTSLSVRTLAQKVGVSPGAPYHHFPDRRSLLLAIASEGFKDLLGRAAVASASGLTGADLLTAHGMGFLEFSEANPRLVELMYESELVASREERELEGFQVTAQTAIREAISTALADASARDVEIRAAAFWSAVYGFAALRRQHNIQAFDAVGMGSEEAARAVISHAAIMAVSPGL